MNKESELTFYLSKEDKYLILNNPEISIRAKGSQHNI